MNDEKPSAHVGEDGRVHPFREHLEGIANLASAFTAELGRRELGSLAGMWHDINGDMLL